MKRYLFFILIIFCKLLLLSTNVYAQADKIEGTNIEYVMPNENWVLKHNEKRGNASAFSFQREPVAGDNSKPSISFMVEQLAEKVYGNDYFMNKIRQTGFKPSHFFDSRESIKLGLINGHLCKASFNNRDSLYFGCVVNGLKAVTFFCEAPTRSFGKYDQEFISFLKSVKYAGATDTKPDASKSKPAATEKGNIDLCGYFPLVNGMQFTYRRNNIMGEHRISETYTSVKDKVLKSGKAIKGYKISSDDANRDNTIIYYYCDAGSVKMYSEMPDYNTRITGYVEDYSIFPSDYNKPDYKKTPIWETEKTGSGIFLSFTELKAGNIGDKWTDVQVVNGNPVTITSEIMEAGLTVTAGGKAYSSVIHIKRSVSIKLMDEVMDVNTQDLYYAIGIGKIKAIEKGKDILLGSYTTTQELMAHNLPAQKNNVKPAVENNKKQDAEIMSEAKTTSYKLGAAAIETMCNKWCGSYKLIEKNGKPVSDFPYGEYLHLETEGDGVIMILQKKNGKLYETGKDTGLEWTVWMEDNQQVIYIRTAAETKGKPVSSSSVPRNKIIFNNKVYEYVNREIQYY